VHLGPPPLTSPDATCLRALAAAAAPVHLAPPPLTSPVATCLQELETAALALRRSLVATSLQELETAAVPLLRSLVATCLPDPEAAAAQAPAQPATAPVLALTPAAALAAARHLHPPAAESLKLYQDGAHNDRYLEEDA